MSIRTYFVKIGWFTSANNPLIKMIVLARDEGMKSSKTALLIEDNEGVAEAGVAMLETCGFKVLHVVTAEDGWEAFQSRPFGLVLSDINLPGQMTGVDLARSIRRNRPDTPIILATGYSHLADAAEREFVVLRKPFGMEQFRDAVKTVTVAKEA